MCIYVSDSPGRQIFQNITIPVWLSKTSKIMFFMQDVINGRIIIASANVVDFSSSHQSPG